MGRNGSGCAGLLVLIAAFIILVPLVGLYYSWALSLLWGWFVVPAFNAPVLGVWQLYGLATTISFMVVPLAMKFDQTAEEKIVYWFALLIRPIVAIFVGSIIRMFV